MIPKVHMPKDGAWIRFWRARNIHGTNPEPTEADRLHTIQQREKDMRRSLKQITARVAEAKQGDSAFGINRMRAEHTALGDLLEVLSLEGNRLTRLQSDLIEQPCKLLANWRVTEREILSADATALQARLVELSKAIKRSQVDISAYLIDAD